MPLIENYSCQMLQNEQYYKNLHLWEMSSGFTWEDSNITKGFRHSILKIGKNISLSVEVGGNPNNTPLLLVIGLGSQMVFWSDNFIYRLIDHGFFVIRFDNRDSGLSSKIKMSKLPKVNQIKMMLRMHLGLSNKTEPVAYNLSDMANDTYRLIQTLQLNHIVLCGASMGGIISQIVAAQHPTLVSKLILLFSTTNRPFLRPPRPKQFLTLIKRPASQSQQDSVKHSSWFMKTVGSPGYVNEKLVCKTAKIRYDRCFYPFGSVQQLNAILSTGSIREYSKKIKSSTLVFHGNKDGLVPLKSGRDICKNIPTSKLDIIEGMGHDIPEYYQPYIVKAIYKHCQYS